MSWESLQVKPGKDAKIARRKSDDTTGVAGKAEGEARLAAAQERLAELQDKLYADNRSGLLVVLQGMDTSGKDGTVKKVMAGLNPVGTRVVAFKQPSLEELDHDFLWRIHKEVPRRGEVVIWNRSHYEDVLVVRVKSLVPEAVWKARYERINQFEQMLADGGTVMVKIYLHIDRAEQKERLLARLEDPTKSWKFSMGDIDERARWDAYMEAYEDALTRCSTDVAPWWVVPGNKKWFRNVVVAELLVQALEGLDLAYPKPTFDPKSVVIPD